MIKEVKEIGLNLRALVSVILNPFFIPKSVSKKRGPLSVLRSICPADFPSHHCPMLTFAGQGGAAVFGWVYARKNKRRNYFLFVFWGWWMTAFVILPEPT